MSTETDELAIFEELVADVSPTQVVVVGFFHNFELAVVDIYAVVDGKEDTIFKEPNGYTHWVFALEFIEEAGYTLLSELERVTCEEEECLMLHWAAPAVRK